MPKFDAMLFIWYLYLSLLPTVVSCDKKNLEVTFWPNPSTTSKLVGSVGLLRSKGVPSFVKGHASCVTAVPGLILSFKSLKLKEMALGPSNPVSTSAFKSDNIPTDVVSQNISNKDSVGSVSYIAKKGCIFKLAVVFVITPMLAEVANLAIKGLLSIWYMFCWPKVLRLLNSILESFVVAILIAVSVLVSG